MTREPHWSGILHDMTKLSAIDWKDVGVRAAKTAVATAIGTLGFTALGAVSLDAAQTAALAGGSAGVTVILNAVIQWTQS